MFWTACKFFITITLLTGCLYPLLITEIATLTMPSQAYGSLVFQEGQLKGSTLIGQPFTQPQYFWPRPSSIDYNPLLSKGSNLGPTSRKLKEQVAERAISLHSSHPSSLATTPTDLLYTSGSNLDPHISPQSAYYQIDRISETRALSSEEKEQVKRLIEEVTESAFGLFGPPCVNVLLLNMKMDQTFSTGVKP